MTRAIQTPVGRRLLAIGVTAGALLGAAPDAAAQTPAQTSAENTIYACYVPGSGTVYRIRVPDGKDACNSPQHVEFSWKSGTAGGAFELPFFAEVATSVPSFWLRNTTARPTMRLENSGGGHALFARSTSSPQATIHAENAGEGATGYFRGTGGGAAVMGISTTRASGGHFENNSGGQSMALYAGSTGEYSTAGFYNRGAGPAVYAESQATDHATLGLRNTGLGGALFAVNNSPDRVAAHIENTGGGSATALYARGADNSAIYAESHANQYSTAGFRNNGDNSAVWMGSNGTRPTLQVDRTNETAAGQALLVNGTSHFNGSVVVNGNHQILGTKNAVVPTSTGMRAVHAEESTEVWFTENGFGRLRGGKAWIAVDPTFAEIVSLNRPYHVFIEEYGDAELYVSRRTAEGFEVTLRGGDADVEFSYRLMAKRRGYEENRLDPAPEAEALLRR